MDKENNNLNESEKISEELNENSTVEKKEADKKKKLIICLCIALLVGVIVLTAALVSIAVGSKRDEGTTLYTLTSTEPTENTDKSNNNQIQTAVPPVSLPSMNNGTVTVTDNSKGSGGNTGKTTAEATKNEYVEYYENLSPNGDNMLSDNANNKYIKLISKKYNVDTKLLVAIYSVPDTGNNFVLQFKNRKDNHGNIIKSPDNLDKVYQIDKDGNVKIATGKFEGNVGVSYAEGMLCFHMVKTLVMEQYPEYFTGLRK